MAWLVEQLAWQLVWGVVVNHQSPHLSLIGLASLGPLFEWLAC